MKNGKGKIILLLIISIISINKVNALSIYSGNTTSRIVASSYNRTNNGYFIKDVQNASQSWTHNFEFNNFTIDKIDYFIINLLYDYRTYTAFTGNLNESGQQYQWYSMDCKTWAQRQQTYADGTSSTYYVCSQWDTYDEDGTYNGTITLNDFRQNSINEIGIEVNLLTDDNYWTSCELQNVTTNTIRLVCPINTSRTTINRLRVRYTNPNLYNVNSDISIGIANIFNLLKSDATSIIENQNQNSQDIQDGINNSDYTGTTEQPDSTDFNSYEQKEQALENMASADMTAVNVGLDANASSWIWTIINRILNTNPIIMSFYITILSIGVIKLIMRR